MARVTIEKCLEQFTNRFDLVTAASRRAHRLHNGGAPLVNPEDDKAPVIALREIEAGQIGPDILHQDHMGEEDLDKSIRNMLDDAPEPTTSFSAPADHEEEEEELSKDMKSDDTDLQAAVSADAEIPEPPEQKQTQDLQSSESTA